MAKSTPGDWYQECSKWKPLATTMAPLTINIKRECYNVYLQRSPEDSLHYIVPVKGFDTPSYSMFFFCFVLYFVYYLHCRLIKSQVWNNMANQMFSAEYYGGHVGIVPWIWNKSLTLPPAKHLHIITYHSHSGNHKCRYLLGICDKDSAAGTNNLRFPLVHSLCFLIQAIHLLVSQL